METLETTHRLATAEDVYRTDRDTYARLNFPEMLCPVAGCGRLAHLQGTTSSMPLRPLYNDDLRCAFHRPLPLTFIRK